jgi:hypothetical protein
MTNYQEVNVDLAKTLLRFTHASYFEKTTLVKISNALVTFCLHIHFISFYKATLQQRSLGIETILCYQIGECHVPVHMHEKTDSKCERV